uniref:Uncharacterized protein n=1 Tax=Cacopsylla melanoneura TaxID=428564 RepID=A0A8D8M1V3_9HEMI
MKSILNGCDFSTFREGAGRSFKFVFQFQVLFPHIGCCATFQFFNFVMKFFKLFAESIHMSRVVVLSMLIVLRHRIRIVWVAHYRRISHWWCIAHLWWITQMWYITHLRHIAYLLWIAHWL